MYDGGGELAGLVFEEVYLFEYLSVGFVDDLVTELDGKLLQQLLGCFVLVLHLHVDKVSFDSFRYFVWEANFLGEDFQSTDLILELSVLLIKGFNHLGHVTNCVRIEAHSSYHPQDGQYFLEIRNH
jgi:hypothetical protein